MIQRVLKLNLVALVLCIGPLAYGGVYKCEGADGKTFYQGKPCKGKALPNGAVNTPEPVPNMTPQQRKALCKKAVKNGKETLALTQDLVELGRDIGKANSAHQRELQASLRRFRPLMSVPRCQNAKGVEAKFYHCISDGDNVLIKCAKTVGMPVG